MNYVDFVIESFWQFQASFVSVLIPILVFRYIVGFINNRFKV